jgi:hypothetical protein
MKRKANTENLLGRRQQRLLLRLSSRLSVLMGNLPGGQRAHPIGVWRYGINGKGPPSKIKPIVVDFAGDPEMVDGRWAGSA